MVAKNIAVALFGVFFIMLAIFSTKSFADEDKSKKARHSFKNKILNEIPYSDEMKDVWELVDGDTNLYFDDLRADRRNKGIKYTTDSLPLIGKVDGVEFQFRVGDENEFSFKSETTPFIGKIKGLSYKGSTSNENSKISVRYTIALD